MDIVEQIETGLVVDREKRLSFIPKDIRKQLKKIEGVVFHIWKLDSVYRDQIQLDCFDACANSVMTLNELESIIKSNGQELSKTKEFDKALKYIVKTVTKTKKLKVLRNKDSVRTRLKKMISGN